MRLDATLWLLVAAVIWNGMLVGASLDQVIKQLPARHRIGMLAFSEYSKAGDLGRGIAWYGALGIGAALVTVVASVVGLAHGADAQLSSALWLALVLTVSHSFTTTRAAPTSFSQRAASGDAARLEAIFDRFERWSIARASLQVLTLPGVTWALVAGIATRSAA
jgi:hypothetical protein